MRETVSDALFAVLDGIVFRGELRMVDLSRTTRMGWGFHGFIETHVGSDLCEGDTRESLADRHDLG